MSWSRSSHADSEAGLRLFTLAKNLYPTNPCRMFTLGLDLAHSTSGSFILVEALGVLPDPGLDPGEYLDVNMSC